MGPSSFIDEAMRSWALRYLREAEADLSLARECASMDAVRELSAISVKKAQLAVQHALSDPDTFEYAIAESLVKGPLREPLLRFMEKTDLLVKRAADPRFAVGKDQLLKLVEKALEASSLIVRAAVGKPRKPAGRKRN